jgi:hypothetical protein
MARTTDDGSLGPARSGSSGRQPGRNAPGLSDTYRMLNNRISIFVSLPMNNLDKLALQKSLNEIGRNLPKAG